MTLPLSGAFPGLWRKIINVRNEGNREDLPGKGGSGTLTAPSALPASSLILLWLGMFNAFFAAR